MDSNIIDYIISAEFEAQKGTVITGIYPSTFELSLENILTEKIMPDGIHNFSEDVFAFRSLMPVNSEKLLLYVTSFNELKVSARFYLNWNTAAELKCHENVLVKILDPYVLTLLKEDKPLVEMKFDDEYEFEVMNDKTVEIIFRSTASKKSAKIESQDSNTNDSPTPEKDNTVEQPSVSSLLIEVDNPLHFSLFNLLLEVFVQKAGKNIVKNKRKNVQTEDRVYINVNFLTAIQIKKEKTAERGAIYKSITIGTLKYKSLEQFKKYLALILDTYMSIKPEAAPAEIYSKEVSAILTHYFGKQAEILTNPRFELIDRTIAKFDIARSDCENSSIHLLIGKFQETFMALYREILFEGRVAIISQTMSLEQLNDVINCLKIIFYPINFDSRIYPYETITSTKLLRFERSFVAAFNNPIVKLERDLWTLIVDLDEGSIYHPSDMKPIIKEQINPLDLRFINNFVNSLKVTDTKIFRTFYNFNMMQIELATYYHYLQPLLTAKTDGEVAMSALIQSFRTTSYYARIRKHLDFEKFAFKKIFGANADEMYISSAFFKNDEYFPLEIQDDLSILFYLQTIDKNCDDESKFKFFFEDMKQKNRIRRILDIAYSPNSLMLEIFMRLIAKAKKFGVECLESAIKTSDFNYRLTMQRLNENYSSD